MHRAVVLSRNDLARLSKIHDSLNAFVAKLNGGTVPAKPARRKPTGAAAHKRHRTPAPEPDAATPAA